MGLLPLFPLSAVLVPGARLPLRVFEPRYLALLRDLSRTPAGEPTGSPGLGGEFGVVAIKSGREVGDASQELHEIGCTARVAHLVAIGDGTFQIMAIGVRRFRLESLVTESPTPYQVGRVTEVPEPHSDPARSAYLAARVRSVLSQYREALGGDDPEVPDDPASLSYRLTDAAVLDLADQQALLSAPDTVARLELGRRLLHREAALVARLHAVPCRYDSSSGSVN